MRRLFANPYLRLFGRAVVGAAGVVLAHYVSGDHEVQALVVAGLIAFCELFTPLNAIVGIFKQPGTGATTGAG